MPRLQHILVPTDFSPLSRVAIDSALSLFKDVPAISLTLVHVVEPMLVPGISDPGMAVDLTLEARVEAADRELEHLRSLYGARVRLEARLLTGSPARTLCDLAADEHFDLIMLTSHGHTGLERVLMGSVAEQVVQDAHCPVLVIKLPKNERGQFLPDPMDLKLDQILVGYDHRKGADLALQMAMGLARRFDAKLTLIHALEPSYFGLGWNAWSDAKMESVCVHEALSRLHEVQAHYSPESTDWNLSAQTGHPWEVITAHAKKCGSDVIVVGPHDHTRWGHHFVGSTAQRVVRLSPCAVLVVK
jgi:nucleotide-binding universal stress UspA family protein